MPNHAGTPAIVHHMTNKAAKRILTQAPPHVGKEVVVIAPGVEGAGYFATSISVGTPEAIERNITLVNEALKKLKQWHRRLLREESTMAKGTKGATATEVAIGKNMKKVKDKKVPMKGAFGNPSKPVKGAMKGGKK